MGVATKWRTVLKRCSVREVATHYLRGVDLLGSWEVGIPGLMPGVKRLLTSFLAHFWCWWERNLPASCKLRPVSTWYKWKIVKNVWCSVEGFFLKLYSDFCVAFWKIFSDYHLHTHAHGCARVCVCTHVCVLTCMCRSEDSFHESVSLLPPPSSLSHCCCTMYSRLAGLRLLITTSGAAYVQGWEMCATASTC